MGPGDCACGAVDFGALAGAAAGEEDVAVSIHVERVHMWKIESAAGEIDKGLLIADIEVVPGSPLENKFASRAEPLKDFFHNRGGWITVSNEPGHIDGFGS